MRAGGKEHVKGNPTTCSPPACTPGWRRVSGRRIASLLVLVVTGAGVLGVAKPAIAALPGSVSEAFFDSTAGDYLGQGQELWFSTVTYEGLRGGYPTFIVGSGPGSYQVWLAAPAGQPLVPGTYEGAQRFDTRAPGHPGIDVFGGTQGSGCNTESARFVVDDATYDGAGNVLSFSARFEDHCEGQAPALFGALSYNSTADFRGRTVLANTLDFTGNPTRTLTITNDGPSSDTPRGFAVTGGSAAEFSVKANTCTGPLGANAACQVTLSYTPNSGDPAPSATLWFNDELAPLGSAGEPANAGQGRFISLTALPSAAISTSLSSAGVVLGTAVTDAATIIGNALQGSPMGNVSFSACQTGQTQTMTTGPCPESSPPQDTEALITGTNDTSAATSTSFAPSASGTWCFSAVYGGVANPGGEPNYNASADNTNSGNLDANECVLVQPALKPTATGLGLSQSSVTSGSENAETFTATVTGQSGDGHPEGTVALYSSSTRLCGATLGAATSDSSSASCSLTPSQLASGPYGDVFAMYTPGAPSSSDSGYSYSTSSSTPAQSLTVVPATITPPPTTPPSTTPGGGPSPQSGYDLAGEDGGVFVFPTGYSGGFYGSLPGLGVHVNDINGMVPSPGDMGYFLVGRDGGVFAFGDAPYLGSLPGLHISVDDIRGIVPTSDNRGYFLVGQDGGVFAFGDAPYLGSLPGRGIHITDVIGIAATPSDQGYWVVASDGTVYSFGNAAPFGSALGTLSPVSGIASTPDGGGYWIVSQNGGVYPFGDAPTFGSLRAIGVTPALPVIGLVPTADDHGYWLIGSDGGVFAFGDAPFVGSPPGLGLHITDVVGAVPRTLQ